MLVSFVEASFFPIPPHPMLGLMCLAEPKKAVRYALICTLASVAGGMLGYGIGFFLYESVGLWLLGVLHLTESFPAAACYLRDYGAEIILVKGATPIPFKLLTITAGFIHMRECAVGRRQQDRRQMQSCDPGKHRTGPEIATEPQ